MKILEEFCGNTAIHGLSFVTIQKYKILKFFWIIIVILGFTGLSVHLYSIISSYLKYKSTQSTYERRNGFNFPDVTVCNLNGISHSNLEQAAEEIPELRIYFPKYSNITSDVPSYPREIFFALGDKSYTIGHSFEDMILACRFEKRDCRKNDFVLFQYPAFINCYTFKRGREESTTFSGYGASLSMTLYMEVEDPRIVQTYDKKQFKANNKGARALLVPPNTIAAMHSKASDVSPGYTTSIGFEITEHIRLSEPYSECRTTASMPLKGDVAYSFTECRNMCIHQIVTDECGCYPTGYVTRNQKNVSSCGLFVFSNQSKSKELLACMDRVLKEIEKRVDFGEKCNCHWPCDETTYSPSISQSVWPVKSSLDAFLRDVLEDHPNKNGLKAYQHYQKLRSNNATRDEIYAWVTSHFLRLNIYATSTIVSVKEQIPMYTSTDLLCNIGGCLGLWVGMSVITIVEVFDLVLKIFLKVLNRSQSR